MSVLFWFVAACLGDHVARTQAVSPGWGMRALQLELELSMAGYVYIYIVKGNLRREQQIENLWKSMRNRIQAFQLYI